MVTNKREKVDGLDEDELTNPNLTSKPHHNFSEQEAGILIVGHGSRRTEANEDVREVALRVGERGSFSLVQAAFLEIEHPDVSEGFELLVQRGAREIIVHPYFLSPGRHTRGDLPREVSEVASHYPDVSYRITEPLAAHPLVIDASIDRIRETSNSNHQKSSAERGKVYLVGAGPGDPGLLTLRARDLLVSCDVILYDYLVDPDVLQLAPRRTELIAVGKVGRTRCTPQTAINQLLIKNARAGKAVVRLKGGDPFLFGRGGEEAEALHNAGVPFEIVPGVSSVLAVPAYAGIPLTHRGYSSSVAVVSGAHAHDGACNSKAITQVAQADTVVVLMGVANIRDIAIDLIAAGKSENTPVAVIRWGTYETQQTVVGTLKSIARDVETVGLRSPSVIVVGDVVQLRESLSWFQTDLKVSVELEASSAAA